MGIIEEIAARELAKHKAAAYDKMVEKQALNKAINESKIIAYNAGMLDALDGLASALAYQRQKSYKYNNNNNNNISYSIPNKNYTYNDSTYNKNNSIYNDKELNVTAEEVQAIKEAGLPLNKDSVMIMRVPTHNADQEPRGLSEQFGLTYQR